MGEKFTSRVGYLIRNFRIASDMTQKELADKCGLNESTIRNYELENRIYSVHFMCCLILNGHMDYAPL